MFSKNNDLKSDFIHFIMSFKSCLLKVEFHKFYEVLIKTKFCVDNYESYFFISTLFKTQCSETYTPNLALLFHKYLLKSNNATMSLVKYIYSSS